MKRIQIVVVAILSLFLLSSIASATEYVETELWFNVPSVVAFTLTLPSAGGATESTVALGTFTTDVEFNTTATDGTQATIEANVVGGTAQSDGIPIFEYDNIGTVNLDINVTLNATLPACMNLSGGTAFATRNVTLIADSIQAPSINVVTAFTPTAAAQGYYLSATYVACAGQTVKRGLTSRAD